MQVEPRILCSVFVRDARFRKSTHSASDVAADRTNGPLTLSFCATRSGFDKAKSVQGEKRITSVGMMSSLDSSLRARTSPMARPPPAESPINRYLECAARAAVLSSSFKSGG